MTQFVVMTVGRRKTEPSPRAAMTWFLLLPSASQKPFCLSLQKTYSS